MKAIILHGTKSSPDNNWFSWLKSGLEEELGAEVWVPALPHPDHPSSREWVDYVHEHAPFAIDNETIVVGHSTGAVAALLLAQTNKTSLEGVFAVATPRDNDHLKWEANDRFFDVPFDFKAIRANAGKLFFVHSDNDPYCPLEQTKDVCEQVGGELIVIPGQGHFNLERGPQYKEFRKLLDIIILKLYGSSDTIQ
jgi:predicted alpha/beta hydrolase family esterase